MERSVNLGLEKRRLEKSITILKATEGFAVLSSEQRRIIRLTLYITERANRNLVPGMKSMGAVGPYSGCRRHLIDRNCHSSLAGVEVENILAVDPDNIPPDYFEANYHDSEKLNEIESKIENFGFPCVVITSLEGGNENGENTKEHSFLALGRYKGNIIVWEKTGFDYPYRVTTLKEEHSKYGRGHFWGLRKLRT